MGIMRTTQLFESPIATVNDITCRAPRAAAGPERMVARHELVFVRRGVFAAHLGGREIVVDPTQVLCLTGGAVARFSHPTHQGDVFTAVELPSAVVLEVTARHDPRLLDRPDTPLPVTHAPATPAVLLRLQRMRYALRAPLVDRVAVEEATLHLVDAVVAASEGSFARKCPLARRAETRRALRDLAERAKLALAAEPGSHRSLADLARTVGASPFHLARVFRDETGLPVHQYRLRLRLALALDRLADGEDNLSALGHELGFASHSHFTQTFRVAFGAPPGSVRQGLSAERQRRLCRGVSIEHRPART